MTAGTIPAFKNLAVFRTVVGRVLDFQHNFTKFNNGYFVQPSAMFLIWRMNKLILKAIWWVKVIWACWYAASFHTGLEILWARNPMWLYDLLQDCFDNYFCESCLKILMFLEDCIDYENLKCFAGLLWFCICESYLKRFLQVLF